jgi:DNA-binding NarL/FixJ family response regulator
MKIKVLLIDDNVLLRKGLAALLALQPDFLVAGDMEYSRDLMREMTGLKPDIVLMDIRNFGVNGLDTVAQIKRHCHSLKVVLLTSLRTEDYVRSALRVGVDGYVLKSASVEELVMALRSVDAGKKYLSPDVSAYVVESFLYPERKPDKTSLLEALTRRERGVLQLIAEGRTNRSAAEFLSLSSKTVEKHRATLMQKLGLRNAAELTMAALEMGLIERPNSISRLMRVSPSGLAPLEDAHQRLMG